MAAEEWRMIKGADGYEISSAGRVRSLPKMTRNGVGSYKTKERMMSASDNGCGYKRVFLRLSEGGKKRFYVHRLVAQAFIDNPDNKPFVNHKDNNPENNDVSNLEWCTHQENMDWMNAQGRAKRTQSWLESLHKAQEPTYRPVVAVSINTGLVVYFSKLNDVKKAGFWPSNVCNCCQGKEIQHKGWTFRYAEGC